MAKSNKITKTPLYHLKDFAKQFNLKNAYIKDESENPYGTIKDRRNKFVVEEAKRCAIDKLALITSGNNGYSLAQFAALSSIKVSCVVDSALSPQIQKALRKVSHAIFTINLQHKILRPEEVVAFVREKDDEVIWDVTNGFEDPYGDIIRETIEIKPDYVVVPVGSGGIYIGISEGIKKYKLKTKIIGIGVQNTYGSYADKLSTPYTPYTKALNIHQDNGHFLFRLSEQEVKQTFHLFKNVVKNEPSSAVVFAAISKFSFNPSDKVIFINSGRSQL